MRSSDDAGLAERAEELNHLDSLLDDCALGASRIELLSGPVGCGKTALLHAFAQRAVARRATLLHAVSPIGKTAPAMWVLSQLIYCAWPLSAWESARSSLPDVALPSFATGPADTRYDAALPAALLHGMRARITHLARRAPVVIAIDDVNRIDSASLQFLLYLMQQPRHAKTLILLTQSEHHQSSNPLLTTELIRQPDSHHTQLKTLSLSGTRAAIAPHIGEAAASERAARYHAVSGGNPLLIRALLDDRETAQRAGNGNTGDCLVVGDSFGQAVLGCLYRSSPAMLTVARSIALQDEPRSPEFLGRITGLEAAEAERTVSSLRGTGIIEDGAFRHPVAREAVLGDSPARKRKELHWSIARMLYEDGGPALSVAHHMLAAERADAPWCAEVLRAAADHARQVGQLELAVTLLTLARRGQDEDERTRTTATLTTTQWRINPAAAARHLTSLADAVYAGLLPPRQALSLVKNMLWHGRLDDAIEMLKFLSRSGTELHALAGWLRTSFPDLWHYLRVDCPADEAEDDVPSQVPYPPSRALDVLISALTTGERGGIAAEAERILRGSPPTEESMEPIEHALLALLYCGQPERVAVLGMPPLQEAISRSERTWAASLSAIQGEAAIRSGDVHAAERFARSALSHITPESWGVAVGGPVSTGVLAASATGRLDDARALLRLPVPSAMFRSRYGLHYLNARGHYYLAVGLEHAALTDFICCGELMCRWNFEMSRMLPWRHGAAEALRRLGDHGQAARLMAEDRDRHPAVSGGQSSLAIRLLGRASDPSREPCELNAPETRIVTQAVDAQPAEPAAAQEPVPAANQPELDDQGSGNPADPLSDAERRVATLAAVGLTNQQISTKLCVTVSTVEQHLTRTYRKLNIKGRRALSTALDATVPGWALSRG